MKIFENEKEYRAHNALHYSKLSSFISESMGQDKSHLSLNLGNLLDAHLLTNQSIKVIKSLPNENTNAFKFAKLVVKGYSQDEAFKLAGIKTPKTLDAFLLKYTSENGPLLEAGLKGEKLVASDADHTEVMAMAQKLKSHFSTGKYFETDDFGNSTCLHQVGIAINQSPFDLPYFNGKDLLFKILLDLLYIDVENKVIKPLDLKYYGKPLKTFVSRIFSRDYNYWIQAVLYYLVLKYIIKHCSPFTLHGFDIDDSYTVDSFRFIVINEKEAPRVFKLEDEFLEVLSEGGEYNNRNYEGLVKVITDYQYAKEKNIINYPVEAIRTGEIVVK